MNFKQTIQNFVNWFKVDKNTWKKRLVTFLGIGIAFAGTNDLIPDSNIVKVNEKYFLASAEIKSKYKLEGPKLIIDAVDKNSIKTTVGDESKFEPNITLNRWDNTTKFKIKPIIDPLVLEKDKTLSFEENKIKFDVGDITYQFYDAPTSSEEGGYEFELILEKKPSTSTFYSTIESQGLEFYKQLPLTQEEIDEGTQRPENVINSYAVYYSGNSGDYSKLGGYNFRAGKAFHIYRIKAIDSDGMEMWCDQDITGNQHKIVCDWNWLDNVAKYPVRVDPTFGYTTAGASGVGFGALLWGTYVFSPSDSGTVSKITAYVESGTTANLAKKGIYKESDNTLIAQTSNNTIPANGSKDWVDFAISTGGSVVGGENYSLVGQGQNESIYKDTVSGKNTEYITPFSWGTSWPSPITWSNKPYQSNIAFSIYATYEASASGVTYDLSTSTNSTRFAYYGIGNPTSVPPTYDRTNEASWQYKTGIIFTTAMYGNASTSNNAWATTGMSILTNGVTTSLYYWETLIHDFEMLIDESTSTVNTSTWSWEGYCSFFNATDTTTTNAMDIRMFLYDFTNSTWTNVTSSLNGNCTSSDCTLSYTTTTQANVSKFFTPSSTKALTRWLVTCPEIGSNCHYYGNPPSAEILCGKHVTSTIMGTTTAIGCGPQTPDEDIYNQCATGTSVALGCKTGYCGGIALFGSFPWGCGWVYDGSQQNCPECYGCPSSFNPANSVCEAKTTAPGAGLWGCDGDCETCSAGTCETDSCEGIQCGCAGGMVCASGSCVPDLPANCTVACGGLGSCYPDVGTCLGGGGTPDGNADDCLPTSICCCGV